MPPQPPESSTQLSSASSARPHSADDHAPGLEEHHVVLVRRPRAPPERLVERPGASEVAHSKCDQADAWLHAQRLRRTRSGHVELLQRTGTGSSLAAAASAAARASRRRGPRRRAPDTATLGRGRLGDERVHRRGCRRHRTARRVPLERSLSPTSTTRARHGEHGANPDRTGTPAGAHSRILPALARRRPFALGHGDRDAVARDRSPRGTPSASPHTSPGAHGARGATGTVRPPVTLSLSLRCPPSRTLRDRPSAAARACTRPCRRRRPGVPRSYAAAERAKPCGGGGDAGHGILRASRASAS